ncbi:hypothetical protein BO85DRAFT_453996 [Aspergillus piperis CBS 112811]|uniref:Uncharacterized protein n=1 Tax=Aspergillus piperis CBS 112811 TaxID=1448313 RepID=A0A8G1VJ83_9EURO|nr:hypothetical protein BO85DRAFT_453996 [Aspergillus piperis CBS 112811]RAH52478.1 hypothetical protein BO85DRAFT_453996 [Aspergillus piperis CBS 112811]
MTQRDDDDDDGRAAGRGGGMSTGRDARGNKRGEGEGGETEKGIRIRKGRNEGRELARGHILLLLPPPLIVLGCPTTIGSSSPEYAESLEGIRNNQ